MAGTVEAKAEWARMAEEETAVEETVTEAQLEERMAAVQMVRCGPGIERSNGMWALQPPWAAGGSPVS